MDTKGLDVDRIKQNVIDYWQAEAWNWPVKIISAQRGLALGATVGRVVGITGYVTCEKFVRGRLLDQVEKTLGLLPGDLKAGAVILRLNILPTADQFELRGYSQTPAGEVFSGGPYPPGLGVSQWELTASLPATVQKIVAAGQRL